MHAVIRTGGKQYRVAEGDVLRVEKFDAEAGGKVELNEVLMVADGDDVRIGSPLVEGGKVTAEVQAQGRGDKIDVIKFKRRKKYRRKYGHRQDFTELRITGISAGAKSPPKKAAAKKTQEAGKGGAGAKKAAPGETASAKTRAATRKSAASRGKTSAAGKKDAAGGKSKAGTTRKTSSRTAGKSTSGGTKKGAAKKDDGGSE